MFEKVVDAILLLFMTVMIIWPVWMLYADRENPWFYHAMGASASFLWIMLMVLKSISSKVDEMHKDFKKKNKE